MKKNLKVNNSTSKDNNYKRRIITKGIQKTSKIQQIRKQNKILESVQQNKIKEKDKNIFQKSFSMTIKKCTEKKNSVFLTIANQRKFSGQEDYQYTIKKEESSHDLFKNIKEKEDELDEIHDKKIDLLEGKLTHLFGMIEDFENQFIKSNYSTKIKKELEIIKEYSSNGNNPTNSQHIKRSSYDLENEKKKLSLSNYEQRMKNKSLNFATKSTIENSISTKKTNDAGDKNYRKQNSFIGNINSFGIKKNNQEKIFILPKAKLGRSINYTQKKSNITTKKKQKNNSLSFPFNKGIHTHKRKESEFINEKEFDQTENNFINFSGNDGNLTKILFPDSLNDEDKCKTERKNISSRFTHL